MTSISSLGAGNASTIQQMLQQRFQQADTDGNGGLSIEEFEASAPKGPGGAGASGGPDLTKLFEGMDADGDGSVTEGEFKTAFEKFHSQSRTALLDAQEQFGMPSIEELFQKADADGDGSLSEEEFAAAAPKGPPPGGPPPGGPPPSGEEETDISSIFDSMDTDGDGSITEDEFTAALEKGREGNAAASTKQSEADNALLNLLKKASETYQSILDQKKDDAQSGKSEAVYA